MAHLDRQMDYNSQLEELIMPEYGRNVQQLVRHAQKIEDATYRQAFCEEIINLIQQLYPQSKSVEDYRGKLWQHLFHIARYDLDAQTPSGEVPTPEDARKKPERVPYPAIDTRFRHYGNNVQKLIQKAISMEEGSIKDSFVQVIGAYMKLAYRTWNREHFVSDDLIKGDLLLLSAGALSLEDTSIDGLANAQMRNNRPNNNRPNNANNRTNNNRTNNNNNSNNRSNNNNNRTNNNNNNNRPNNNNRNNRGK